MRKSWRILFLPLLVGAAPALGALIWILMRGAPGQVWRLADGSTIAVEGFTYGKEHRFIHGNGWQKVALPLLPAEMKRDVMRRFGCRDWRLTSRGGETLVVWTFLRKATRTSPWNPRIVVVDANGLESSEARLSHAEHLSHPPMERFEAWQFPSFPRRGEDLRLRIYNRDRNRVYRRVGEFTIRNPDPGPHPTWTARPLPIAGQAGELTFSLTGLRTGLTREEVVKEAGTELRTVHGALVSGARELAWTRADFHVTRGGKPDPAWEPVMIRVADATGNADAPPFLAPRRAGGESQLYFGGTLWPDEVAWRLRVEFARATGFAPEELWTVRNLVVPAAEDRTLLNHKTRRYGVLLHLEQIRGPYSHRNPRWPEWMQYRARIHVALATAPEGVRVTLVQAVDEQGRPLTVQPDHDTQGRYYFGLHGPAPVKRVDLTFAVHKSRFVEFLAAPSRE
jgi:hypothetical protein